MPMPKRMERRSRNKSESRMLIELFNVLRLQLNITAKVRANPDKSVLSSHVVHNTVHISLYMNSLSYRKSKNQKTDVEPEHYSVRLQSLFSPAGLNEAHDRLLSISAASKSAETASLLHTPICRPGLVAIG